MAAGAQMYYRIPSKSRIKNPSRILERFAVRVDGSVWIVSNAGVGDAAEVVENLRAAGADAGLLYYREDQQAAVKRLALDALGKEVGRIQSVLDKKMARARNLIAEADRLADADALKKARGFGRSRLYHARRALKSAEEAAVAFDLTSDVADLLTKMRDAVAAEAEAFLGTKKEAAAVVHLSPMEQIKEQLAAAQSVGLASPPVDPDMPEHVEVEIAPEAPVTEPAKSDDLFAGI